MQPAGVIPAWPHAPHIGMPAHAPRDRQRTPPPLPRGCRSPSSPQQHTAPPLSPSLSLTRTPGTAPQPWAQTAVRAAFATWSLHRLRPPPRQWSSTAQTLAAVASRSTRRRRARRARLAPATAPPQRTATPCLSRGLIRPVGGGRRRLWGAERGEARTGGWGPWPGWKGFPALCMLAYNDTLMTSVPLAPSPRCLSHVSASPSLFTCQHILHFPPHTILEPLP
jgi:hypothetical protein